MSVTRTRAGIPRSSDGPGLDALGNLEIPSRLRMRARREREPESESESESDPLHRICVASSASGDRSPFVRITWPAIASCLNRSATVVSPLLLESRYG